MATDPHRLTRTFHPAESAGKKHVTRLSPDILYREAMTEFLCMPV